MRQQPVPTTITATKVGRKLTIRRKLAYMLICVIVALLCAEAGIRLRARYRYGTAARSVSDQMSVFDAESGLRLPRPGAEQIGSRIHIKINSLGFRGDEFARNKPANTVRIACVGASTTFCAEVSNNQATWPARLQSLLQAKHPDVRIEVVNAGVGGYVINDSLKNLEHRVLPLEPDLVIFYEANNDMALDSRDLARERGLIAKDEGNRSSFSKFMSKHSLLYDLAEKNLAVLFSRQDTATGKLSEIPGDLPDRFIGQLGVMHDRLSAKKIPLVLSCFLTKYRRDEPRETQIADADVAFFYMPWMTIDGLLNGMDLYNDAIVRFARSRQIPVIEDRTSVPGDAIHFADFAHMTDAGCEAMAQRFARFIEEQKILDPIIAATRVPVP